MFIRSFCVLSIFTLGCAPQSGDRFSGDVNERLLASEEALSALSEQLEQLEADCARGTDLQSLSEDMAQKLGEGASQADLSALSDRVGANEDAIEAIHDGMSADAAALSSLAASVVHRDELTTMTNRIDWIQDDVFSIRTRLVTAESQISSLNAQQGAAMTQLTSNTTQILSNTGQVQDNSLDIGALQSSQLAQDTQLGQLDTLTTQHTTDIDTNRRDVAMIQADYITQSALNSRRIDMDTVWTVGSSSSADYATLQEAIEATSAVSILPGATLTLEVEDGSYAFTKPLQVEHPDGARLFLVGNTTNPEYVTLSFTGSEATSGLVVHNGHVLGGFEGFTLQSDGVATGPGISLYRNAHLNAKDIIVDGWGGCGIVVAVSSSLYGGAASNIETSNNGTHGLHVAYTSSVLAYGVHTHHNGSAGVHVVWSSTANVGDVLTEYNGHDGVSVTWGSSAYADNSTSQYNKSGYSAHWSSTVHAKATLAKGNTYGFYVSYASSMYSRSATIKSNSRGFSINPSTYVDAYYTSFSGNSMNSNLSAGDNNYSRVYRR